MEYIVELYLCFDHYRDLRRRQGWKRYFVPLELEQLTQKRCSVLECKQGAMIRSWECVKVIF